MKAAVIHKHGGLDELVIEKIPKPKANSGEAIIAVKACGLNYLDIFVRRGSPGLHVDFPHISGGDIAGVIDSIDESLTGYNVGQRIMLDPMITLPDGKLGALGEDTWGGLTEFVKVPIENIIPLPEEVSFDQAAALPIAYGTAWRMMITRGQIKEGEEILILGASGGVGTGALQISKMIGAKVWVAASSVEKIQKLKNLGADEGINYIENPEFHKDLRSRRNGKGVDVVVNFTGGDTWATSLKCLNQNGRLLTCGATAGFDPPTDIRYIWRKEINIIGSDGWRRDDLLTLVSATQNGQIKPVIDSTFPLEEVASAQRLLEERKVFGKLIIHP